MNKISLLLLFVAMSVSAQSDKLSEKNLIGKWVFKNFTDNTGAILESPEDLKPHLATMYMEFKRDKTCVMNLMLVREGTWTLDTDARIITLKDPKTSLRLIIDSFTPKEMVLSMADGPNRKLRLTKQ